MKFKGNKKLFNGLFLTLALIGIVCSILVIIFGIEQAPIEDQYLTSLIKNHNRSEGLLLVHPVTPNIVIGGILMGVISGFLLLSIITQQQNESNGGKNESNNRGM